MTSSFYAGPDLGYLNIASWDDLVAAVQAGALNESHWVECKEHIRAKEPGANRETAKDLASLTVDGGVLAIGVRDKKKNQPLTDADVVGTDDDIDGLLKRLTHIARGTTVRPAIQIIPGPVLQHPDKPNRAALLISVPASASAPHMVAGSYWGRDAQGKRTLDDVEVDRLFHQRRLRQEDFESRLRALSDTLDPFRGGQRRLAHAYVVARPDLPADGSFMRALEDRNVLTNELISVWNSRQYRFESPSFLQLDGDQPHPEGIARDFRVDQPSSGDDLGHMHFEADHMRLFVGRDGSVQVASGRGSRPRIDGRPIVDVKFVAGVVHQVIMLAAQLAAGRLAYTGTWTIGVHINNLAYSYGVQRPMFPDAGQPYATPEYTRVESTSTAAMIDDPVSIVDDLLHDHARGAGHLGDLRPLMDPAAHHR